MAKKKILIVSGSFYPTNSPRSFRTTELVKEFSRQNHDVTVYINKEDKVHLPFEIEHGVTIKNLGKLKFSEIDFQKGNKYIILFKRVIRRILVQLFEYPNIELMYLVKKALKNESGYDLLISIAAPHSIHWGVAWAWRKEKKIAKTWIADCGDPYYLSSHDSFNKLFYFQYLEKWFSEKADYISIPFSGLQKYFFKEFKNKYTVIPQGFNFEEIKIIEKPIETEVVTFSFAGGFMKNSRDPRKFLDYLSTIDFPFKFIVYNRQQEFTTPYKSKLKDKLFVKDYIPRKELLFELSKMDFLVNFEYDPTNQAPSKLIDYSLTKRPILMIKNKEFNKSIIDEFLNKNYINKFEHLDIQTYNIKNVAQKFIDLAK